jgi:hypothetical protein
MPLVRLCRAHGKGERLAGLGLECELLPFAVHVHLQLDAVDGFGNRSRRCHGRGTRGLCRPGGITQRAAQAGHQRGGDHPLVRLGCRTLQHGDSLLQWVVQLPVATNWQRDGIELRLEHGLCVVAAGPRPGAQHACIAGQFLVEAEATCGKVDKRVEPVQATQQRHHGVGLQVAAGDVRAFVLQHKVLFGRLVALLEITRQHDPRPQQADRGGQSGHAGRFPAAVVATAQDAQCTEEAALLPGQQGRHQQHPGNPDPPQHCRQRGLRRSALAAFHQHGADRHHRSRRSRRVPGRRRQQQCKQRHRHAGPQRVGRTRAQPVADRAAQQQHQEDGRGDGETGYAQPTDQFTAHRPAP